MKCWSNGVYISRIHFLETSISPILKNKIIFRKKGTFMPPDSASFISSVLKNPATRWDFIAVVLALIRLLITISPKIFRWYRNFHDRRSLKNYWVPSFIPKKILFVPQNFTSRPTARMLIPARKKMFAWSMP